MAKADDPHLLEALTRAYIARARLFHRGIHASKIDLLISEIDTIDSARLNWDRHDLGISASALARMKDADAPAHQVFAHPDVIIERPHLIAYYRNIVTISKKGISQILFSTEAYESGLRHSIFEEAARQLCRTLNKIVSSVIDATPGYTVDLSRQAILAEIGTELQGTWANVVGRGAPRAVEKMLAGYIEKKQVGERVRFGHSRLDNGWEIRFASEPDVAFTDPAGTKQIAIEIKGSLDKAGAQTRYGEAKKSFAKQLAENPRCHTIYLASCFTEAVIHQLRSDGQVRDWYNLTSILYDEEEHTRFLEKLFHIVNAPG